MAGRLLEGVTVNKREIFLSTLPTVNSEAHVIIRRCTTKRRCSQRRVLAHQEQRYCHPVTDAITDHNHQAASFPAPGTGIPSIQSIQVFRVSRYPGIQVSEISRVIQSYPIQRSQSFQVSIAIVSRVIQKSQSI